MKLFYRFCFAVIIVWLIIVFSWVYCTHIPLFKQDIYYSIPSGTTAKYVGRDLNQKTKLPFYFFFRVLLRLNGGEKSIQAGEYFFPKQNTLYDVVHKLITGDVVYYNFTVIDGWNFVQVMQSLNNSSVIIHSLANSTPKAIALLLGINSASPEGWIYPDTYHYSKLATDISLLKRAHEKMVNVLQEEWRKRAPGLWYNNPYQALIVASLIEKETAIESEKPLIAAVILTRLKLWMPLQIDASVRYGLGDLYHGKLTKADLRKKTPYNTYERYGLPPTPIAMPSVSSIRAALHPAETKVLYFVAKNDGTHYFSTTFSEHHRAVLLYQIRESNK